MRPNNNFGNDDLTVRPENLDLIQQKFSTYSSELVGLASDVSTWASTCYDDYVAIRTTLEVEEGEGIGATAALLALLSTMKSEYKILRDIAKDIFKDTLDRYPAYNFHLPYPTRQEDQFQRINDVMKAHQLAIDAELTPLLPTLMVTRLQNAFDAAMVADDVRDNEQSEARHARSVFIGRWNSDTRNLRSLFRWCVMIWGDDNVKLNDFGFLRSSQMDVGGGGGPVPSAPSGLNFSGETLSWTAVSNATSYGISLSYDGGTHWESDFNSDTNSSVVPVAEVGKLYYRVRARNANGYGEYSGTFEHLFGLSAVDNFAFDNDQFTWNPVEFANGYDIQYSLANEENWVLIFNGNATSFAHTPASGSWTYRIRASYGSIKSEWVEIAVEQV